MQPFLLVSHDKYSVDKKTVYNTLCGPLITLMRQFALNIGTSLKLQPKPKSTQDFLTIFNQETPQFFLRQADVNILYFFNTNLDSFKKIEYSSASNVIDYQALSYIAYKSYPGKIEVLIYYKLIVPKVYDSILVIVMFLSILIILINNRINFVNFINNTVILSSAFVKSVYPKYLAKGGINTKKMCIYP